MQSVGSETIMSALTSSLSEGKAKAAETKPRIVAAVFINNNKWGINHQHL